MGDRLALDKGLGLFNSIALERICKCG